MTTNWKILNLKRKKDDDLITTITYECSVSNGTNYNRRIGNLEVDGNVTDEGFIPYNDLTEGIILGWLTEKLGTELMSSIEAELINEVNEMEVQRNNNPFKRGVPWNGIKDGIDE